MSRYKLTVKKSDNTAEDVFFNVPEVNGKYEVKFLLQNKTIVAGTIDVGETPVEYNVDVTLSNDKTIRAGTITTQGPHWRTVWTGNKRTLDGGSNFGNEDFNDEVNFSRPTKISGTATFTVGDNGQTEERYFYPLQISENTTLTSYHDEQEQSGFTLITDGTATAKLYDEILHLMISCSYVFYDQSGNPVSSSNLTPNYITITKIEQKY